MIFLGYPQGTKGYHFFRSNKSIYVATTATFVKNFFPNCSEKKLRNKIGIPEPRHPNAEDDNTEPNHPTDNLDNPPQDPPEQTDEDEDENNQGDSTKPQSPTQRSPKTSEDASNEGAQAPQGEPHFNIGHAPTPQREYVPPSYNLPHECHYPARIRIPRIVPDNIYGNRRPVDIKREIAQEREWTCRVLEGNLLLNKTILCQQRKNCYHL